MKNSEVLKIGNERLLSSIDKQRRFILQHLTTEKPCPSCGILLDYFIASCTDIDDLDLRTSAAEGPCRCTDCGRGLLYTQPLMGEWRWALDPKTIPRRDK